MIHINKKQNNEITTQISHMDAPAVNTSKRSILTYLHKLQRSNRFNVILLLLLLLFSGLATFLIKANARADTSIQEGIAQKVLRFHVIANSDTEEDQQLKLKVKDALVKSLAPQLEKLNDITMVRATVMNRMTEIEQTANTIIQQQGYSYPVAVTLEKCYFPLKVYGAYTFPPGYYEALRVKIGNAAGKNWWCVMFPPLCFVDETYSIVDENSKEKLMSLLSDEEYDEIVSGKTPVKIKFKLVEKIKDLLSQ
ncbi:MAG: hypothetical protein H6Q59_763 [Firmicutes bacterium]|nr:hypothetical protein [Bacillota bacterium]